MRDYAEFIARHVVEDGDCLRWTASCCNGHPGMRLANGKTALVRRVQWEQANGPIPAGKIIRQTCETPKCVSLEHSILTTMRSLTKQLGALGVMSGPVRSAKIAAAKRAGAQAKTDQETARAIRASDESSTVLALRHGLAVSTICRIKRHQVRREFGGNPFAGLGA